MKLIVEIVDFLRNGKLECGVIPLIATDERDGEGIYGDINQAEQVARLLEVAGIVGNAVNEYYEKLLTVSPNASKNTSGEP